MTLFHVGQKVACVDAGPFKCGLGPVPLIAGAVYTVAGFDRSGFVILVEQPGRDRNGVWRADFGYDPSRFRPIVERKTDISVFQAMLNPVRQTEDA